MEFITLENVPIADLTICFNDAFSDYFVKFNATESYLETRWEGAGIDFTHSAGVMDDGKLVGFIIIGIRDWNGFKTAFNAGTGVIPTHRGNGLTEKMYQFLMPKFKKIGVQSLALEVIQENAKAIHVYEKVGLKINRGLNCFGGEIKIELSNESHDLVFKKLEKPEWEAFKTFYDFEPAWENNNQAVKTCQELYTFYGVEKGNQLVGFAIIKPENKYISQFGVNPNFRNQGVGKFLFYHLSKHYQALKINNVEDSRLHVLGFIESVGMKNSVNQYEMVSYL